jgi:alkyl hydroperoxide reductase subunit F
MYELVIAGGGPAGVAAGVYAARKKIKTLFITDSFGGQSLVSADIQNWIGTKNLSGLDLAKNLEEHLRAQSDMDIVDNDLVKSVEKSESGFKVLSEKGKNFETKTLLICTGSRRRRLGIPGEDRLDGKGVAFCSTCDAPIFAGKAVAVVGGGNAGLEAVVDLLPYASKIYLLEKTDALRGDAVTQERMRDDKKVTIMTGVESLEILGEKFVSGLKYREVKSGEEKELPIEGVFVEIGSIPNADFVKGLVELNKFGEIVIDPRTQASSASGIWAAGDVTDVIYKQNNIAAGDAIKAVLNIYEHLNQNPIK